jgi:hypothetical protein
VTNRLRSVTAQADAFLVAPRATVAERSIAYVAGAGGAAGTLALALTTGDDVSGLILLAVAVLGFDLFGGAVANATDAARRWWHRAGRGPKHHLGFVAAHVHPFLVAALVEGFTWTDAAVIYGMVLLAAVIVTLSPTQVRRPIAFGLAAAIITIAVSALEIPSQLAWFAPILTVKLVLAHLLADHGE